MNTRNQRNNNQNQRGNMQQHRAFVSGGVQSNFMGQTPNAASPQVSFFFFIQMPVVGPLKNEIIFFPLCIFFLCTARDQAFLW